MKVKIGDVVCSNDFGAGKIVAMTHQWCIYVDGGGAEFALPWEDVFLEVEAECVCSAKEEHNLSA